MLVLQVTCLQVNVFEGSLQARVAHDFFKGKNIHITCYCLGSEGVAEHVWRTLDTLELALEAKRLIYY